VIIYALLTSLKEYLGIADTRDEALVVERQT